jgi:type I restriction enzyme S subunit
VRLSKERTADPDADGFDRYVGLDHIDPGDLKVHRWGSVADGTTFTSIFRPGQVLFGKRRAYQRKVAVADFEGVCSGDIYVLESTDPSVLVPELLPFICQTEEFVEYVVGRSAGSLSPRTNWTSVSKFELLLPSLTVQRQHVDVLRGILFVQECLRNVDKAAQSLGNAHNRTFFEANSNYPLLPLTDMATRVGVGIASSVTHAYATTGVPIIQNSNIRRGAIDFAEGRYVTPDFDQANATKRLRSGDVVIARTGVPGAAAVVPERFVGGHTFTTLIVSPDQSHLLPKYLELWLNSGTGQAFFASRKAGGVQQNMNATVLQDLPVPQIPLDKQRQLIEAHGRCHAAANALQLRLDRVSALRESALAQLSATLGLRSNV